jgi:hypothetical protein
MMRIANPSTHAFIAVIYFACQDKKDFSAAFAASRNQQRNGASSSLASSSH